MEKLTVDLNEAFDSFVNRLIGKLGWDGMVREHEK